jgi:hypothetical protein
MGTRSLTYFYQDGKPFCGFYRQMDGYPDGHGVELGEILAPITLVNGYQMHMKAGTHANGPGCLAAQVIASLKNEQGLGGIYMIAPTPEEDSEGWQEYEYHIFLDTVGEGFNSTFVGRIECRDPERVIFSGDFKSFLKWARKPKMKDGEYVPVIVLPTSGVDITKHAKPELKDALKKGIVSVTFTKADGSKRTMHCTLNGELIPEDKRPIGNSVHLVKDPDLFKVFDLDKQDWRSFRKERVLNYEVV